MFGIDHRLHAFDDACQTRIVHHLLELIIFADLQMQPPEGIEQVAQLVAKLQGDFAALLIGGNRFPFFGEFGFDQRQAEIAQFVMPIKARLNYELRAGKARQIAGLDPPFIHKWLALGQERLRFLGRFDRA